MKQILAIGQIKDGVKRTVYPGAAYLPEPDEFADFDRICHWCGEEFDRDAVDSEQFCGRYCLEAERLDSE